MGTMTVEELLEELEDIPKDTRVAISVLGQEAYATQVVWQGSEPATVIIDDFPNGA